VDTRWDEISLKNELFVFEKPEKPLPGMQGIKFTYFCSRKRLPAFACLSRNNLWYLVNSGGSRVADPPHHDLH